MIRDLFSVENLAATVVIPPAPALDAAQYADWPMPGRTAEDTARWCHRISSEYHDMLAAVVLSQGSAELTGGQVEALIPQDWRDLIGGYLSGDLCPARAEERGVLARYVPHDDGRFHFTYRAAA